MGAGFLAVMLVITNVQGNACIHICTGNLNIYIYTEALGPRLQRTCSGSRLLVTSP